MLINMDTKAAFGIAMDSHDHVYPTRFSLFESLFDLLSPISMSSFRQQIIK